MKYNILLNMSIVAVLIFAAIVAFTPTFVSAQERVPIVYTQEYTLQKRIEDLEQLIAQLQAQINALIAQNNTGNQATLIPLKSAVIVREKHDSAKNTEITIASEKVTIVAPRSKSRSKSQKSRNKKSRIIKNTTPHKSTTLQEVPQKEITNQEKEIKPEHSNHKETHEPAKDTRNHHGNLFFEEAEVVNPGTISHRVRFAGTTDQRVVVTLKDSNGNIVDITEGTDTVKFPNLVNDEEYTVTAETGGYCSESKKISNLGEETVITFEKIEENIYTYRWESDLNNREYECSSHLIGQRKITFIDENPYVPSTSPAHVLEEKYNILLSNKGITWSSSLARGLLRGVSSIPHDKISKTNFVLVDQEVENDIHTNGNTVYVSKHAFNNAKPKMVMLDGKNGTLLSHRVFHALIRFYTNNGTDRKAAEKILDEKFGVSLHAKNVKALTGEHPDNFQEFQNEEVLDLISALAETPEGQYIIPGLTYILRRKDGHPHPLYPGAPAVAWPRGPHTDSYIEFMETAFYSPKSRSKPSEAFIHRLILHEKSHFLWGNVLSDALRKEWINVAGWYENKKDIDGWSNQYTTSFVSPYAHTKNPNEDFAETVAYYITNPNRLLNVSPEKYEFIRKYIMHGNEYILDIREDLRFEVLNLLPDYDYPGKIRGVSVIARGTPNEDKKVTIELVLNNAEGYNDGANWARTRLMSESGLFKDVYMHPTGNDTHRLRGVVTIPKNTESGYWRIDQVTVKDLSGNTRTEGIVDFGFMLYINNADEDLTPPQYIPDSLKIKVEKTEVESRQVHKVTATWNIQEDVGMETSSGVYANFVSLSNPEAYSWGEYGKVHNNRAEVIFHITEYFPSGEYTINYINMKDKALNAGTRYFSNDPNHEAQKVFTIETANPDTTLPTLDLNRISIDAVPFNKESPDGKTRVTITYHAKDDSSGVGKVYYALQDPNGKTISSGHYHENFHTLFFEGGDPAVYKKYVAKHILPAGSAPGTWGLREMIVEDKGGNIAVFNFTEILHFELTDSSGS